MGKEDNTRVEEGVDRECESAYPLASPIQDFYTDSKVLITGATGFIGKALVEKLLRSCRNISTIYLLIRPKKGLNAEIRHEKLLSNSIFDSIKEKNADLLKKLVTIPGDVAEDNLGLSECDRKTLTEEVNLVFHSAATVRFNEKLQDAIELNTLGTIKVIQLCREMKNLKVEAAIAMARRGVIGSKEKLLDFCSAHGIAMMSTFHHKAIHKYTWYSGAKAFVHVSTAYSNAEKYEILESVYPSPCDLDELAACCKHTIDKKTEKKMVGNHPNNYTMTKAVSEYVISTQANDLPVAIVRPSIVTGAWKEPVPGWVDNVSGISGIMIEIGRGTLKSIICDDRLIMDVIPVDVVVNTLITAAWQAARNRSKNVPVYNCTSGTLNPISWYSYGRKTEKYCLQVPSKYVQWYPGFSFTTNRYKHAVIELFLQFIPALFVDLIMIIQGMKPIMFDIAKKFKKACKNGEFFALHEWKFQCDNMVALNKVIPCEDKDTFCVDVTQIDWDDYIRNYVMGLRKFVLKDGPKSLEAARRKLNRLYWVSKMFQFLALTFLWNVFKWVFCGLF